MNADEVYSILNGRQDRHEAKCDERQASMHEKLDKLERHVYIGLGVLVVIEIAMIVFGPTIAQMVFSGS